MKPVLVLDSTPLALLFQKPGYPKADECRLWLKQHLANGVRVVVPEIVNYELRRELLRMGKTSALKALAAFNAAMPDRYLPLTTAAMDVAAELWAKARSGGSRPPTRARWISTSSSPPNCSRPGFRHISS